MDWIITPKEVQDDDSISEDPGLLSADHPLMERFQRALKEHLLKVKNQLETEISDIDHQICEKNEEISNVGAKLFDLQNEIENQRDTLDKYGCQILEISDKRRVHESNVMKLKTEYYEKEANCKELKRLNNQVSQEITGMRALESEIAKWNAEVNLNLFKMRLTTTFKQF
jgi:coiled-coil domain-containing protein 40